MACLVASSQQNKALGRHRGSVFILIGTIVIVLLLVLWVQVRVELAAAKRERRPYEQPMGERVIRFVSGLFGG